MTTQELAYTEIERLVKSFKDMPVARRGDDPDRVRNLEREISQVDAEIDQRVYVLYGLTEEVKVVEGN